MSTADREQTRPWTVAALEVPLKAVTVLGLVTWVNRLLGHPNLGALAITLTAVAAVVLHLAITSARSRRFTVVAAGCSLALAGLQVGLSTNPSIALVPTFGLFAVAAWGTGRARGSARPWTEWLGRAAFGVAILAGLACVSVLVLYLLVTAGGASWG